jgi:hypothetical protein
VNLVWCSMYGAFKAAVKAFMGGLTNTEVGVCRKANQSMLFCRRVI